MVASFTDAWIETEAAQFARHKNIVASFTDAWIETEVYAGQAEPAFVASFTDAWIETDFVSRHLRNPKGRVLHGRVD